MCTNVGNKGGQKNNYSVKYSKNLPTKYSNKAFVLGCPYLPLFAGHGSAGLRGPERAGAAGCQHQQTGREAAGSASRNPEGGAQEPWSECAQSRNTTRSNSMESSKKNHNTSKKTVVYKLEPLNEKHLHFCLLCLYLNTKTYMYIHIFREKEIHPSH